jgi:hypothetical protein
MHKSALVSAQGSARLGMEEPAMITKADDYPVHQTPDPIAYAGADRNFYDRYFFNGYNDDASVFFAVALGCTHSLALLMRHFVSRSVGSSIMFAPRGIRQESGWRPTPGLLKFA